MPKNYSHIKTFFYKELLQTKFGFDYLPELKTFALQFEGPINNVKFNLSDNQINQYSHNYSENKESVGIKIENSNK